MPDVKLLCFSGELRQLFANLIGNALDAMAPGGGRLLLRVRYAGMTGVRITVADTGSGMSPGVLRRIFEPFFTTKEAIGTGLGSLGKRGNCQQTQREDARAQPRSRKGGKGGTVFTVFFPFGVEPAIAGEKPALTDRAEGALAEKRS